MSDVCYSLRLHDFDFASIWSVSYVVNSDILHQSSVKKHYELVIVVDCQLVVVIAYPLEVFDHLLCQILVDHLSLFQILISLVENIIRFQLLSLYFVGNLMLFF